MSILGLAIQAADAFSSLIGDGMVKPYIEQLLDPKWVPFLFVGTMMVSKIARNRTLVQ